MPTARMNPTGGHVNIRLDAVTLARAGSPVLGPLTLELREARIGIVGRNGSGKSSLLRLIAGLHKPSAGRVLVDGIDTFSDRYHATRMIGILFQNPDHQIIFPIVREELAFGLEQQGMSRADAGALVDELLATYGLENWATRQVSTLSEGQRRWLCLMAVLVTKPRVILLDEPFAGLDIPTVINLTTQFARLQQQLVMVTHEPAHLLDYDRVIWIEKGCVKADGPAAPVLAEYSAEMRRHGLSEAPCWH